MQLGLTLGLLRKENCGVQKVNAGIARSCRLGQMELMYEVQRI